MAGLLQLNKPRLGDLLVQKGYLSAEHLDEALAQQHSSGGMQLLGEIVVAQGYCSEDQVLECVADDCGIPYIRLDSRLFDPRAVELLPREFLEKLHSAVVQSSPDINCRNGRAIEHFYHRSVAADLGLRHSTGSGEQSRYTADIPDVPAELQSVCDR